MKRNRLKTGPSLKSCILSVLMLFTIAQFNASCAGAREAAGASTRGRYLAGRGVIIPPEEIHIDSYVAAINFNYPDPQGEMGIFLHNSSSQMRPGQEGILHIGIQGRRMGFEDLPPMNLVFVVDASYSMNEDDKIAWVRESVAIFMEKVRPVDSLALVSFNETARVDFPPARMDSAERRQRFLDAVNSLRPSGTSNMEAGLRAGYREALANFREGSVNRVLFFSDGTEFSSRLSLAGAGSGDVRVSLIWDNRNDLDLHVFTPAGEEIFFGRMRDSTGGMLDVDMNVRGETIKPVENVFWPPGRAPYGRYRVVVRNFRYHEHDRTPTRFQVEVKSGLQYFHFDGVISGTGRANEVEVAAFEFAGASAQAHDSALIFQLAETYRQMGITTTTIGVGLRFDLELMMNLAEKGGGSSRFISGREEMRRLFYTEFSRMVALVATDLDMVLQFAPGVEILETWGYQHRIAGSRIYYHLPGLHLGDYETILVRYRLPSRPAPWHGEMELARFTVNANDLLGRPMPPEEQRISIVVSESAVDGISSGMVLHSGTMLRFAQALKAIGTLYYAAQDDLAALSQLERNRNPSAAQKQRIDDLNEAIVRRLDASLRLTRDTRFELENARLRLDNPGAFTSELEILARYDEILGRGLIAFGGIPAEAYAGIDGFAAGFELFANPPANLELLQNRLSALHREIILSFSADERHVVALAPFGIRGTDSETPLLDFINESAIVSLSQSPGLALVERSRLDAVRAEQNLARQGLMDTDAAIDVGRLLGAQYMITGQVIPMSAQAIIFARVIHVQTGEIISAAQVFVENALLGDFL